MISIDQVSLDFAAQISVGFKRFFNAAIDTVTRIWEVCAENFQLLTTLLLVLQTFKLGCCLMKNQRFQLPVGLPSEN